MPSWPYDNECPRQRLLTVSSQCVVEFAVNGVLRFRHHTEIEHRCRLPIQKNNTAEIPIPGDEKAPLLPSDVEQLFVGGSRQTEISGANNVMPHISQVSGGGRVDVLVQQKSQTDAVRKRMSSAPTKAIAYRMHAWISSAVKSG